MSQTSATPIAVHATLQSPARRSMPRWVYRLVVFWLPAVVFGYGFVMANHSDRHAANATGDKWVEVDLTARVSVSDTNRQLGFLSMGMLGALLLTRPANKPWPDRRLLTVTAALAGYVLRSALSGDPIELWLGGSMVPVLL